jgi:hypothetical protein
MSKPTLRVLVLILAILLSFGIWFGSVITTHIFRSMYTGSSQPVEFFMPVLTRFAIDWYWSLIALVALCACAGLVLSLRRVPAALVGAVGVAVPLLTGWFTLFSLSFDSFLGPVSPHHPQRFDFGAVLFSFGGFFSITFILIVHLLGLFVRDAARDSHGGHSNSVEATRASARVPQL